MPCLTRASQSCWCPFSSLTSKQRARNTLVCWSRNTKRLQYSTGKRVVKAPQLVTVERDGSDTWRLEPIVETLRKGGVGIVPTDSLPAFVCDLQNRDAVLKMYAIKGMDEKKPLSILCRNLADVSHYTTGFPISNVPGEPNWFNVMRRLLPGPYTIILPATKNLPSQCIDALKGKTIHRKSVGVRLPDCPVCQALLDGFGSALLCTSVHVEDKLADEIALPDVGSLMEAYGNRGIDFIVDSGPQLAVQSTVVDMTGAEPVVVRYGKGDSSVFE